jgi:hypothetical protein
VPGANPHPQGGSTFGRLKALRWCSVHAATAVIITRRAGPEMPALGVDRRSPRNLVTLLFMDGNHRPPPLCRFAGTPGV